jgi:hypothetical protein
MQASQRRAADAAPADRRQDGDVRVSDADHWVGADESAETLDDAAVAALLEGASPDASGAETLAASADNEPALASAPSPLFTLAAATILVVGATIAFFSVALRAPMIASLLFMTYAVITPAAIVASIREDASRHS